MNCRTCQRELSAYLDGEVSGARRAEIEAHVAGCAACRQRLAALQQIAAGVRALPRLQPAPQFVADVRRKLRGEQRRPWFDTWCRPVWLKVPLEAVAVVLVLGAVLVLVHPPRRSPPDGHGSGRAVVKSHEGPPRAECRKENAFSDKLAGAANQPAKYSLEGGKQLPAEMPVAAAAPVARPAPADLGDQQPEETITVVDADAAAVRQQVTQVAVANGGRVLPQAPVTPNFQVEVPRPNVLAFKSQLRQVTTRQQQMAGRLRRADTTNAVREADLKVAGGSGAAAVALDKAESGTAVLEIQVVPPKDQ